MTMERPHEHLEELIAADALDGLDEADRRLLAGELSEHGPGCIECARLIVGYAEVAGRLAMTLDPVAVAVGAEHRLISAARRPTERRAGPVLTPPSGEDEAVAPPEPEGRVVPIRPGRPRRWIAAAAAAAVIAIVGGVGGYLAAPQPAGVQVVALSGAPGQHLSVAFEPGQDQAWVIGSNLPQPGEGKVYELWFRTRGSSTMEPGGIFVPREGSVIAPATVGDDLDLLAVTIEPAGGSDVPTQEPIFASPVPPS